MPAILASSMTWLKPKNIPRGEGEAPSGKAEKAPTLRYLGLRPSPQEKKIPDQNVL
jgi:hypothetical protein